MSCDCCGTPLNGAKVVTYIGMDGVGDSFCACGSAECACKLALRLKEMNPPHDLPDAQGKHGW